MSIKNKFLLLLMFSVLPACSSDREDVAVEARGESEPAQEIKATPAPQPKFLRPETLQQLVAETESRNFGPFREVPFDTLAFDKVIAYNFIGNEGAYPTVLNLETGRFVPVILKQRALGAEQVNELVSFLTDPRSYGKQTAACFYPHLGFVFYQGNRPKWVVDICLDCNYLLSTTEIPATVHNRMDLGGGKSYGLRGFSEAGIAKIVSMSKELQFSYGE
ncbi:hypothetical protein [Flavilitoribacter nigricans]|uniref:Uncharacterized protein n=1 Tax=Flavilitoribacter nigricans (strain ATCC 23147 / DSM 23189 / NBRC 102662 / NCIMB 1420 / SS-2) TaxID=1122177 RepID=A0A2D0NIW2_FLAN2|nr:hypothetical protein [Flavilitoribacter nigricans]PHN08432.1 hypothetical protein CRP01_00530 [Flavilitoribacter nigricans DSM 23189 = NBRC 102662]